MIMHYIEHLSIRSLVQIFFMRLSRLALLFLCIVSSGVCTRLSLALQVNDDSLEVRRLLERVTQTYQQADLLSYEVALRHINTAVADSVVEMSGTVWLEPTPSDSMFGALFHVRGKRHDSNRTYDYYYDGLYSYEKWDYRDSLRVFYAFEFGTERDSRPKARVALRPFIAPIVDVNLATTLFEHNPSAYLTKDTTAGHWILTLDYPPLPSGATNTTTLHIDETSYTLTYLGYRTKWQGVSFRTSQTVSHTRFNHEPDREQIFVGDRYKNTPVITIRPQQPTSSSAQHISSLLGSATPSFSYPSHRSGFIDSAALAGKVILLDFWESWCGWCLYAIPKLNDLHARFASDDFVLIGVTTENREQVEHLIEANDIAYLHMFADSSIVNAYNVAARPTYVLINREGRIAAVSQGDLTPIEATLLDLLE